MSTRFTPANRAAPHALIGSRAPERRQRGVVLDEVGDGGCHGLEVLRLHPHQRLGEADPERIGDGLGDHRPGATGVEVQLTVQVGRRVQHAEEQVDVGDGGVVTAKSEAGRAGGGTNRCGP